MTTAAGSEERVGQNWELLEAESARGQNISEWSTLDAGFAISGQEALLAIGPDSLRHLLLPTVEEAQLEDTQSSGVQILKRELILKNATNIRFVDVVCLKDRLHDLFTLLATDIIARLDVSRTDVSRQCVILLDDWRELFSRESSNILGIDSLTGLFGELICLREFVSQKPSSLENWSGPGGGVHDFSFPGADLEVKTSRIRNGRFASIHGINQLAPGEGGSLYLAFFRVELVRSGGESLPDVIQTIKDSGVSRVELEKLLALEGYSDEHRDHYQKIRFRITEDRLYRVDDAFPKIVPESLKQGAPDAQVIDVRYRLDLTGEPPHPLADDSFRDFIQKHVKE